MIDRDPQHLLLPMGGFAPVRQKRRPGRLGKIWRRHAAGAATTAGLGLAVIAALVALTRPPLAVYLDADVVHVGSVALRHAPGNGGLPSSVGSANGHPPASVSLYTGGAAMVLVVAGDGSLRASAVSFVHGDKVVAVCTMAAPGPNGLTEHCTFTIAGKHISADDHLDFSRPGAWRRAYSDGRNVDIGVPSEGGAIPVPFAIGE